MQATVAVAIRCVSVMSYPEDNLSKLSSHPPLALKLSHFLRQDLSGNLGSLIWLDWLARTSGVFLFQSHHAWIFHVGVGCLNSGPHACIKAFYSLSYCSSSSVGFLYPEHGSLQMRCVYLRLWWGSSCGCCPLLYVSGPQSAGRWRSLPDKSQILPIQRE